jgi:hypothetical protein
MVPKARYQLRPRQAAALPNSAPENRVRSRTYETQNSAPECANEDIQRFLRAMDSFPECLSKDPRLSFHQHLRRIIAAQNSSGGASGAIADTQNQ